MQRYTVETEKGLRINAYLASVGVASRRGSDALIENKKVSINKRTALLGDKVKRGDVVEVEGVSQQNYSYLVYHKPRGEVTGPIKEYPKLHPVGRLDKESEGLLVLTDNYRLTEALLNPSHEYERVYIVTVREQMTPRVERLLMKGMTTQEGTYGKAKRVVIEADRHTVSITLTEGKKHEIRRMLNALSLTITSLKRIRFAFISLGHLGVGKTRTLSDMELKKIHSLLGQ